MTAARRWLVTASSVAVMFASTGCGGEGNVDELRDEFDEVASAISAADVEGPSVETSKDKKYLVGRGTVTGDVKTAAGAAAEALADAGWEAPPPEPVPGGMAVVARSGDVAVQLGFLTQAGSLTAPAGTSIVQMSVAWVGTGFDWSG